jgi:hypothetical protein
MPSESDNLRRTDRELLVTLRAEMKFMRETVREIDIHLKEDLKNTKDDIVDHEKRIRVLENFRWWIIGASAGAGFIGNLVGKLVFK